MSEFSRETLLNIIETDHVQCGEASALARMALAAMDSEPVEMPLDYLQGHKDGLEWASQLAEANHPETGDWLYDDPIELAKAIRKGPDMPPVQPVADSEPDRNPVLAYADSYRDMAKQGVESVPIWSVITDLERNIAPLYRHAQPVPVVPQDVLEALQKVARIRLDMNDFDGDRRGIADCLGDAEEALIEVVNRRAAMLAAAPHDTPALNSVQSVVTGSDTWIQVSERMPEKGQAVLVYRPKAHEGGDSDVRVAVYGRHNFEHGFGCYWEPSHWMPLPAAPQEVGDA
ncbi:DUF551 domain-containing protein [Klebsiella pneumoniae]|uniref:DUF551 domain-containing protein n=1 Tax=Klebsiella pneumoniae TaxID=573 RepID=UPI000650E6A9|nr:DUF551 domain-containing protein [Klebsiella pneumoniae]KMH19396.1 hypothetical protein SM67_02915 [Klebsiella pneumoniae]MBC4410851.1 DUF551 domain-containing protein [Klebsiella pneumoniae]MBD7608256.1 DUF551 domain-containing protein [Klebsiella pneumoniae]MBR7274521.1 DUF551 domain-containing protein [Klebsiella pneumoniae]MBR7284523.1 DUF551 domain-containing protein [Klebsiella pneumoniae]